MGSVFDRTFIEVMRAKLEFVASRRPVCKACGHDPINRLADGLRQLDTGKSTSTETDARFGAALETGRRVDDFVSMLLAGGPGDGRVPHRTLIPVDPI
jgi:hypothetical protein